MRVEVHDIGSILHVVQRGTRGVSIAETDHEKWRFLRTLFYLNSTDQHHDWDRDTCALELFAWPPSWKMREPLVDILAWTLMPNHFHLLLREIKDGGIAKFMQRLCGSTTRYFNALHEEKGTLFQGSYKGRLIVDDADLRYVSAYIMGKNVFELYPGSIQNACKDFEKAWQFGIQYPFSSLSLYALQKDSPIFSGDRNPIKNLFENPSAFQKNVSDMIYAWIEQNSDNAPS